IGLLGIRIIARDQLGKVIGARSERLDLNGDPNYGEAMTTYKAILFAVELEVSK
ncbi:hypothetical protein U1Q18_021377, partial [Sarracenia purpurea var. burkii]